MKRVILLGAGFAVSSNGPSTNTITQRISSCGWPKYLLKILETSNEYSKPNFEDVIAAIELELSYYKNKERYRNYPLTSLFQHKKKQSLRSIYKCYTQSLDIICQEVIKYIDNRDKTYDSYLYAYLTKFDGETKIYSLNYDREPALLLKSNNVDVYEGVTANGKFEYDVQKFVYAKTTFFNLHGSVYLKANKFNFDEVSLLGHPRRMKGLSLLNDDTWRFSPIITGRNKTKQYLSDPFLFGHSVLSQDIHDADILDVIGYSGGDEHINAAVKYLGNDNLKVNIVDFCQNPDEYDPIREQTKIEEYGGLITSFSRVKEQVSLIPEGDDLYFDKAYNTHLYIKGVDEYLKKSLYNILYEKR